jgi:Na+-translocating ferredoxin:NAD+ oxidoreductase subunit G
MKEIVKLIFALGLISSAAGLMLSLTNKATKAPIEAARKKETLQALSEVLPAFDNQPDATCIKLSEGGADWTFYVARKEGNFVGAAFQAVSTKGYGGPIAMMVGVNSDGTVRSFRVLSQQETPGLGTKITVPPFSKQFDGRDVVKTRWLVKKDGGDFDSITGATISSRAVVGAMKSGLDVFARHREEIEDCGK